MIIYRKSKKERFIGKNSRKAISHKVNHFFIFDRLKDENHNNEAYIKRIIEHWKNYDYIQGRTMQKKAIFKIRLKVQVIVSRWRFRLRNFFLNKNF